jgi:hypothetical protein
MRHFHRHYPIRPWQQQCEAGRFDKETEHVKMYLEFVLIRHGKTWKQLSEVHTHRSWKPEAWHIVQSYMGKHKASGKAEAGK